MTKAQRSYGAFLRAVKRNEGLNQKQAQAAYRNLKERLDRPPSAKDLKAHPRMTRDAIRAATEPPKKRKAPKVTPEPKKPKKAAPKPKKAAPKKAAPKKVAPAKKAPAKPPAKRPPPAGGERVFHAGIRYRKGKAGAQDELRVEVAVRVAANVKFDPATLNTVLQHYATTGELPKGVHADVITWQHGKGAEGTAETRGAIEQARTGLLERIAGAGKFEDVGGG